MLWLSQMPLQICVVCFVCNTRWIDKIFKFSFNGLNLNSNLMQLVATVFGQLWRLEPVPCEKKEMWRREMEWLVSVSDHIVELIPSWQTFPDGSKLEV